MIGSGIWEFGEEIPEGDPRLVGWHYMEPPDYDHDDEPTLAELAQDALEDSRAELARERAEDEAEQAAERLRRES